jgi:hypothetical protein
MKICPLGAELFHGRDRQTDMKLAVTLGNFVNMSNWLLEQRPKHCIVITEALTYISEKEL